MSKTLLPTLLSCALGLGACVTPSSSAVETAGEPTFTEAPKDGAGATPAPASAGAPVARGDEVVCTTSYPTGSHLPKKVCRPRRVVEAEAEAARKLANQNALPRVQVPKRD